METKALPGRPTQVPAVRATSLAKFSVRPQRLAFIIHTSLGKEQIEKIILYNTWTWGGFYNLLVPCTPNGISKEYRQILYDYDPDRLIFCGRVPAQAQSALIDNIQPFNAVQLKSIFPTKQDPRNFINDISTPQLFVREANALKNESYSAVQFPHVPKSNPFRPFAITHFGLQDQTLRNFLEADLKAKCINFSGTTSLGDYLSRMDMCSANLYPIRLTQWHLKPTYRMGSPSDAVITFGEPYEIEGLCMFWMRRMCASDGFFHPRHEAFAYLSPDSVKTKEGLSELATWLRSKHQNGHVELLAPPALKKFLGKLQIRLAPLLGCNFKYINIVTDPPIISITKSPESEVTKEIGWADNATIFEAPLPTFDTEWLNKEAWVVDCDFSDFRTQMQSFFPPRRPGQVELLLKKTYGQNPPWAIHGGPWRLSRKAVACLVTKNDRLCRLKLPEPEAIFNAILSQSGFSFKLNDKYRYVRSTTNILKKAGQLRKLRNKGFRDLIIAMTDSKPLIKAQIIEVVKPDKTKDELGV